MNNEETMEGWQQVSEDFWIKKGSTEREKIEKLFEKGTLKSPNDDFHIFFWGYHQPRHTKIHTRIFAGEGPYREPIQEDYDDPTFGDKLMEKYQQIEAALEYYRKDHEDDWFNTPEWQEKERQADQDIAAGRIYHADSVEEFFEKLGENNEDEES